MPASHQPKLDHNPASRPERLRFRQGLGWKCAQLRWSMRGVRSSANQRAFMKQREARKGQKPKGLGGAGTLRQQPRELWCGGVQALDRAEVLEDPDAPEMQPEARRRKARSPIASPAGGPRRPKPAGSSQHGACDAIHGGPPPGALSRTEGGVWF